MRTATLKSEVEARRVLVSNNLRELMKSMGLADRFDNPDDWLDAVTERPRLPKQERL